MNYLAVSNQSLCALTFSQGCKRELFFETETIKIRSRDRDVETETSSLHCILCSKKSASKVFATLLVIIDCFRENLQHMLLNQLSEQHHHNVHYYCYMYIHVGSRVIVLLLIFYRAMHLVQSAVL